MIDEELIEKKIDLHMNSFSTLDLLRRFNTPVEWGGSIFLGGNLGGMTSVNFVD